MTITELIKQAHETATEKGFLDVERTLPHHIAMITAELSEAINADRKGKRCDINPGEYLKIKYLVDNPIHFEDEIKDTLEDELADAVIYIMSLCGHLDIDLESHILAKMAYNKTRPRLNGSKY